jgi:hypothetical protein
MRNVLTRVQSRILFHFSNRITLNHRSDPLLCVCVSLQPRYYTRMSENKASQGILEKVKNIALGTKLFSVGQVVTEHVDGTQEQNEKHQDVQPKKDRKKDKKTDGASSLEVCHVQCHELTI